MDEVERGHPGRRDHQWVSDHRVITWLWTSWVWVWGKWNEDIQDDEIINGLVITGYSVMSVGVGIMGAGVMGVGLGEMKRGHPGWWDHQWVSTHWVQSWVSEIPGWGWRKIGLGAVHGPIWRTTTKATGLVGRELELLGIILNNKASFSAMKMRFVRCRGNVVFLVTRCGIAFRFSRCCIVDYRPSDRG